MTSREYNLSPRSYAHATSRACEKILKWAHRHTHLFLYIVCVNLSRLFCTIPSVHPTQQSYDPITLFSRAHRALLSASSTECPSKEWVELVHLFLDHRLVVLVHYTDAEEGTHARAEDVQEL